MHMSEVEKTFSIVYKFQQQIKIIYIIHHNCQLVTNLSCPL